MTKQFTRLSHSITVKPYERYDDLFDHCQIKCGSNMDWTDEPNIYIGEEELSMANGISIKLDIDPMNTDLQKESDLYLAVILKDNYTKKHRVLFEQKDPLKNKCFMEIDAADTLAVLPANYAKNSPTLEMQIYKKERIDRRKIAIKTYKINYDVDNLSKLPKEERTPDEFEAEGYGKDTPWAVHYKSLDFNNPIDEVVSIWINTKYKEAISSYKQDTVIQMGQSIAQTLIITALKDANENYYWDENNRKERKYTNSIIKLLEKSKISQSEQETNSKKDNFSSYAATWAFRVAKIQKARSKKK